MVYENKTGQLLGASMYSDGENFIVSAVQLHVHVYCIPVCCTYIEDYVKVMCTEYASVHIFRL